MRLGILKTKRTQYKCICGIDTAWDFEDETVLPQISKCLKYFPTFKLQRKRNQPPVIHAKTKFEIFFVLVIGY